MGVIVNGLISGKGYGYGGYASWGYGYRYVYAFNKGYGYGEKYQQYTDQATVVAEDEDSPPDEPTNGLAAVNGDGGKVRSEIQRSPMSSEASHVSNGREQAET